MVQEERIEEEEEIQTPQAVQPLAFVAPVMPFQTTGFRGFFHELTSAVPEVWAGASPREISGNSSASTTLPATTAS